MLAGALVCVSDGATTTASYLSVADRMRLKQVLSVAWHLQDIPSVHYAVLGYKLLGEAVPKQQVRTFPILYCACCVRWLHCTRGSICQ